MRSAELARRALLEAEDALKQEKHVAEERLLEVSSLQRQLLQVQRQLKEKYDGESEKSTSTSVRSDARLISAPPPTPSDKRDLVAALASERERAIEAEEELRLAQGKTREAERRARHAGEGGTLAFLVSLSWFTRQRPHLTFLECMCRRGAASAA